MHFLYDTSFYNYVIWRQVYMMHVINGDIVICVSIRLMEPVFS